MTAQIDAPRLWTRYRAARVDSWGPQRFLGAIPSSDGPAAPGEDEIVEFVTRGLPADCMPGSLLPGQVHHLADAPTAALCLHVDQEIELQRGNVATIYRGQASHPGWTIQPSIDRYLRTDQVEHHRQLYGSITFSHVLRRLSWQAGEWLPKGWHLDGRTADAMARHHGIASSLIDFTTDPSVAVYMAQVQARETGAERAQVFGFRATDLGPQATFTVPPPPVLRSARQHGLYYLSDSPGDEPRMEAAHVVTFPAAGATLGGGTTLTRDGEQVDLMHADGLLAAIETRAREWMRVMPVVAIHEEILGQSNQRRLPSTLRLVGAAILESLASIKAVEPEGDRYLYRPSDESCQEWFRLVTDVLHALLGVRYLPEGGTSFLRDALRKFVQDNWITTQIYVLLYARMYSGTPLEGLLSMVRHLNTTLLDVTHGSAGAFQQDLLVPGARVRVGEGVTWPGPTESAR